MDGYRVIEVTRFGVVLLRKKQVRAIHSLRQQLKPTKTPVTYWSLVRMLMFGRTRMFVAVPCNHKNEFIGVALLISNKVLAGRRDTLEEVVVLNRCRRKGVGDQLVDRVVKESHAKGVLDISLMVSHDNPAAQNLYGRHGFKQLDDRGMMRCTF